MNLRQIAKEAGVSLTTVSLVLNRKPGVGEQTRERVRQLLLENGYPVDAEKKASQGSICFLKYIRHSYLVNGNPGFVTQIMDAVERECRKHGYDLQVVTFSSPDEIELNELMSKSFIKGAILLGTELLPEDMGAFRDLGKPLMVVDNALAQFPVSTVTMDNRQAVFSAVEHLTELGYRRMGFLFNSIPSENDWERRYAFEKSVIYKGIPFEPELVFSIFPTMEGAYESVKALLERGVAFPPALVANNDSIAIGAMRALKESGLRIPEDISIVGFDGLPFSALAEPPLTTVNVSCRDIGYWAVRLLLEAIDGRMGAPCKMAVGTQLEVRGSTRRYSGQRPHPSLLPENS